jgi:membrane protease YdiL (CAAX protease family)
MRLALYCAGPQHPPVPVQRVAVMPDARNLVDRDWIRVPLFAILVYETAALIARSFLEVRLRHSGYEPDLAGDLSYLVVPPILLLLMYPAMRDHGHRVLALYRLSGLGLRLIAIGIALGITLRCAFWGGLIATTSFGLSFSADGLPAIAPYFSWQCPPLWPLALGILVSALLIPPIEEVINRGFFLHRLLHRGRLFAVVASSVLFAIYHNPQTIYLAFAIGLFFAVATLNSGTLWIATLAHAAYNFTSQLDWRCLNGRWNPLDTTPLIASAGAMATALMLVSLLLSCLLISKRIIGPGAR